MRILLYGTETDVGKAFIKSHKKEHEIIALDTAAADFTDYAVVREVFKAYSFDCVLFISAKGFLYGCGNAFEFNIFKNLSFAAALYKTGKVVAVIDFDRGGGFNDAIAGLSEKNKRLGVIRINGLYGPGCERKNNVIAKLYYDVGHKPEVVVDDDVLVSPVPLAKAVAAIDAAIKGSGKSGLIDIGGKARKISTFLKAEIKGMAESGQKK
jgi:dTDP-4-dehydrorhamnose reductase